MPPDQKHDYWRQHFKFWQQSQLSQRDYCKYNNLSLSSFGYWRNRLNCKAAAGNKRVPVNLSISSSSTVRSIPAGGYPPGGSRRHTDRDIADYLSIFAGTVLMLRPGNEVKVYLYADPVDRRKSIDGLSALVQQEIALSPALKPCLYFVIVVGTKLNGSAGSETALSFGIKDLRNSVFAGQSLARRCR